MRKAKAASRELVDYRQMKALSNEDRVRISAILCERIASPKEISEELDQGLSQVSYHVSGAAGMPPDRRSRWASPICSGRSGAIEPTRAGINAAELIAL
jgi:hypothetical protein